MATKPQQWDMRGKTVLITGERAGSATKRLGRVASSGAKVVITGRDAARGEDARVCSDPHRLLYFPAVPVALAGQVPDGLLASQNLQEL
jgi:NAD(P)-dependent dehydrogenase (short-subunit alcohol dehydrogenase family)